MVVRSDEAPGAPMSPASKRAAAVETPATSAHASASPMASVIKPPASRDDYAALNALVRAHSTDKTAYVVLPMPPLPRAARDNHDDDDDDDDGDAQSGVPNSPEQWLEWTRALVHDLPPVLLIHASKGSAIMSVSL